MFKILRFVTLKSVVIYFRCFGETYRLHFRFMFEGSENSSRSPQSLKMKAIPYFKDGRGTSVCIATHYGLDGPGIESR